jgi:hypothetical protein
VRLPGRIRTGLLGGGVGVDSDFITQTLTPNSAPSRELGLVVDVNLDDHRSYGSGPRVGAGRWLLAPPLALVPHVLPAQTAIDEESPWPRVCSTNGNLVPYPFRATNWAIAPQHEMKPVEAEVLRAGRGSCRQ